MAAAATTIGASMISAILRPMADKAATVAVDHCDIMFNIKRNICYLRNTLHLIEGILEAVEEVRTESTDDTHIQDWLRDLIDVVYDARDVLDDYLTVSTYIRQKRASRSVKRFSFFLCFFDAGGSSSVPVVLPLKLRFQLASKIRSFRERLDMMLKQNDFVKIHQSVKQISQSVQEGGGGPRIDSTRCNQSGPFVDKQKNLFVGRKDEKEEIMKKLSDHNDNSILLIPIWGMGGVGKTTLAQSIYNDEEVTEVDYPIKNRTWLCVGEKKFKAMDIIMKILNESGTHRVEVLQRNLVDKFNGSKFIIVLDDVWDVDSDEWDIFWNPLTYLEKGGLIIITTRKREVVTATNSHELCHLRPLSDKDCWLIFQSYAFGDSGSNTCSDLEVIGGQIVKKLDGLPLAARVVGSSLLNKPHATWRNFLEAWELNIRKNDRPIMAALRWSFNLLLPYLKQCFVYCSLFPKDHAFDEKLLVEMWMAHGFIENMEGEEQKIRPEVVGAQYFNELVHASLIQRVGGKYMMHDMIHELAVLVSNKEYARANNFRSIDQMKTFRHITIDSNDRYLESLSLCKSEKVLTLYTIPQSGRTAYLTGLNKEFLHEVFKQLKSIRILVLSHYSISVIPECISELRHLRYLDISETTVKSLPNSLRDLHNLQMLAAPLDAVLPKDIVNMVSLRYLRANLATCKGVGKLISLQELSSVNVCKDGNIRELGDLPQLHGKLIVKGLKNVTSPKDAIRAKMQDKTYIDQLELVFGKDLEKATIVREVLDAFGCPPNLIHLKIDQYSGVEYPSWMANEKLPDKLQTLKLSEWHKLKLLPPLGDMKSLKSLSLWSMHEVERLGDEVYGEGINGNVFFPMLESLSLDSMKKLKEWGDINIKDTSASFFPCLRKLRIYYCPKLVSVLPPIKVSTSDQQKDEHPIKNGANIMTSLSRLDIEACDGLVSMKLDASVSLKESKCVAATIEELSIKSCKKLKLIQFESLPSLKLLDVVNCDELTSVVMECHELKIEKLSVAGCGKLSSLTINNPQGLNSIEVLNICDCPMLELISEEGSTSSSPSLPLSRLEILQTDNNRIFKKLFQHNLVYLKEMVIEGLTEVEENKWEKLTLLKTLRISNCLYLKSLPPEFHKLSSLKKFNIFHCPQLESLPVGGLPDSLEELGIIDCPLLYKRCKDKSGVEWHMIKHIPELIMSE